MSDNLRTVQYFDGDWQRWVIIDFKDLKEQMLFRMFEPDGEPVIDEDKYRSWFTVSDSFFDDENNTYIVETIPNMGEPELAEL
jgi:hypothetical protein